MILRNNTDFIVYHGGTEVIKTIDLTRSRANLDFGTGFYATTSMLQAERWAKGTARRRKTQKAYINKYFIENLESLIILEFEVADINWFQYVVDNRSGKSTEGSIDIVIGPVADDDTTTVFQAYMAGLYGSSEKAIIKAIEFLEVGNLKNQVCFRSLNAVNRLKWIGADEIWLQGSR